MFTWHRGAGDAMTFQDRVDEIEALEADEIAEWIDRVEDQAARLRQERDVLAGIVTELATGPQWVKVFDAEIRTYCRWCSIPDDGEHPDWCLGERARRWVADQAPG